MEAGSSVGTRIVIVQYIVRYKYALHVLVTRLGLLLLAYISLDTHASLFVFLTVTYLISSTASFHVASTETLLALPAP
jgi:hypothetical protein